MAFHLTAAEARVLGALIEKEITTPEYYPLSLNALVNACNQKSNRDPVMTLDEDAVRAALRSLSDESLARSAGTDSRVPKYEHRLSDLFNFHRHEIAVLCVLLLRGPQTPGELRTRTERMYSFEDLDSVHSALNLLMKREPPLVVLLSRQPGTKEARYAQLLSGDPIPPATVATHAPESSRSAEPAFPLRGSSPGANERIAQLESELSSLRSELADLRAQFAAFQKQFQ
ncbi:MAG TPA: DUF480 domain-containing protein [Candidatus Dormibacteraeota bacterium]|nr:DUF480 domain-containing protein [Candidatus Dormibacteraeota bacterium]